MSTPGFCLVPSGCPTWVCRGEASSCERFLCLLIFILVFYEKKTFKTAATDILSLYCKYWIALEQNIIINHINVSMKSLRRTLTQNFFSKSTLSDYPNDTFHFFLSKFENVAIVAQSFLTVIFQLYGLYHDNDLYMSVLESISLNIPCQFNI
jgi:hypothetical protein